MLYIEDAIYKSVLTTAFNPLIPERKKGNEQWPSTPIPAITKQLLTETA